MSLYKIGFDWVEVTNSNIRIGAKYYPIRNVVSHKVREFNNWPLDWSKFFKQFCYALLPCLILCAIFFDKWGEYPIDVNKIFVYFLIPTAIGAFVITWLRMGFDDVTSGVFYTKEYKHHQLTINTNGSEIGIIYGNEEEIFAIQKAIIKAAEANGKRG